MASEDLNFINLPIKLYLVGFITFSYFLLNFLLKAKINQIIFVGLLLQFLVETFTIHYLLSCFLKCLSLAIEQHLYYGNCFELTNSRLVQQLSDLDIRFPHVKCVETLIHPKLFTLVFSNHNQ